MLKEDLKKRFEEFKKRKGKPDKDGGKFVEERGCNIGNYALTNF